MVQLCNFIDRYGIDVMLVNETKLTGDCKMVIRGFTIIRKDRTDAAHTLGGVAIIIRNGIQFQELQNDNVIENITLKISNLRIVAAYRQPTVKIGADDIRRLFGNSGRALIVGDLNAQHWSWNCTTANAAGRILYDTVDNDRLNVHFPDTHTHYPLNGRTPSTIDIVINKNIHNITHITSLPELDSDHNPIVFGILERIEVEKGQKLISFKNTNWTKFRSDLDRSIHSNSNINNEIELNREIEDLVAAVQKATDRNSRLVDANLHRNDLPREIKDLIAERNRTRRQWQTRGNPQHKHDMKRLNKDIRRQIRIHKNKVFNERFRNLKATDNSLWKATKRYSKRREPIPALEGNGNVAHSSGEKADLLASTFEKVHDITNSLHNHKHQEVVRVVENFLATHCLQIDEREKRSLVTTPHEINDIIKTLHGGKAPGVDGIKNIVVRNLSAGAVQQLTNIINAILTLQIFPNCWTLAVVVGALKRGKAQKKADSYRPISLLNVFSKIAEKIIYTRLDMVDEEKGLILDSQFGFRTGHSSVGQIVRIVNDTYAEFNNKKSTVMLLLDIEKAFDRVWIDGLIYKMIRAGYPGHLIYLINSYARDRRFCVRINNTLSEEITVHAGVPQGSVLGPRLFLYSVNDIPEFKNTKMALFADDTAVLAHSFSAAVAAKQIQAHARILERYFESWKIKLNANKSELLIMTKRFTENRIFQPIKLAGGEVYPKDCAKYLGVTLDKRLNFKTHISETINKASCLMRSLYPLMISQSLDRTNKALIYTALIRPVITYGCPVWSGISMTAMSPLQVFQNKWLRLILGRDRYTRITELHELSGIETIKEYVHRMSETFYTKTQHSTNRHIKNITRIRENNAPFVIKHKLPYQHLAIFTANHTAP